MEKELGTWAKYLVKRNYELWLSFGSNRCGEYLVLMVQGDRRAKRIFFLGGNVGERMVEVDGGSI